MFATLVILKCFVRKQYDLVILLNEIIKGIFMLRKSPKYADFGHFPPFNQPYICQKLSKFIKVSNFVKAHVL